MQNGWLCIGDVVRCDEEGFYYFIDWKGDMIVSGVFNVYLIEVECVFVEYEFVQDVVVIGVFDDIWVEVVMVYVVFSEGVVFDVDVLFFYVFECLVNYKCLKIVEFIDEIFCNLVGKFFWCVLCVLYWFDRQGFFLIYFLIGYF